MTATAVGLAFPLLAPWHRHLLSASPQNYPQRCWRVSPKRFGDFSAIIWSSLMFVWSSGDFDQARDIVSSHSLPAQSYPCSWNTDFIQMLKDKRSSIEKKVFTTLNDKNRITHDNTGKQVLIQKLVQSSAILNEHNFFDYGMRSHLQTSEMIKGCTVLGCAHEKEQVSKHKHQPSLLPPIKLFHLLNPRQRHR